MLPNSTQLADGLARDLATIYSALAREATNRPHVKLTNVSTLSSVDVGVLVAAEPVVDPFDVTYSQTVWDVLAFLAFAAALLTFADVFLVPQGLHPTQALAAAGEWMRGLLRPPPLSTPFHDEALANALADGGGSTRVPPVFFGVDEDALVAAKLQIAADDNAKSLTPAQQRSEGYVQRGLLMLALLPMLFTLQTGLLPPHDSLSSDSTIAAIAWRATAPAGMVAGALLAAVLLACASPDVLLRRTVRHTQLVALMSATRPAAPPKSPMPPKHTHTNNTPNPPLLMWTAPMPSLSEAIHLPASPPPHARSASSPPPPPPSSASSPPPRSP